MLERLQGHTLIIVKNVKNVKPGLVCRAAQSETPAGTRHRWRRPATTTSWLTGLGMEGAGLGGLRAVNAPPAPTTIAHGVLVGWSAARAEKRGRVWKSARELALEPSGGRSGCGASAASTEQLPDLAVWRSRSGPPIALISESGGRREDRQKKILEGWGDAVFDGRYSAVLYDCANDSVARAITRLVKKVGVTRTKFTVVVQPRSDEIAALSPAADDADEPPTSIPQATGDGVEAPQSYEPEQARGTPLPPASVEAERPISRPAPELRHPRPAPSASGDIERSSGSRSQGSADDGVADLGDDVCLDDSSGLAVEIPAAIECGGRIHAQFRWHPCQRATPSRSRLHPAEARAETTRCRQWERHAGQHGPDQDTGGKPAAEAPSAGASALPRREIGPEQMAGLTSHPEAAPPARAVEIPFIALTGEYLSACSSPCGETPEPPTVIQPGTQLSQCERIAPPTVIELRSQLSGGADPNRQVFAAAATVRVRRLLLLVATRTRATVSPATAVVAIASSVRSCT